VALDGRQLWQLKGASVSGMPAISADARKVAFAGDGQRLAVYDVSAGELRKLDIGGDHPSWAPAGDRLAYDDGGQVRVYDLARGTGFEVGRGTEPSWSPDGTSLAVRVDSEQVDLVNVQTRDRRVLIDASSYVSVPRWSPNGEWMMYTRRGPRHWWSKAEWTGSEPSQILIRQVKTGTETSVGEFYKANPGDYTWVTNRELCRATPAAK
jgi:Tol biopolymer transport system component